MRRIARYGVVGALAFAIDYVTAYALYRSGMNLVAANSAAFLLANAFNFLLGHFWAFTDAASRRTWSQAYLATLMASVVGLVLNDMIVWMTVGVLAMDFTPGKVLATGITMVFNFVVRDRFIYRRSSERARPFE